MILLNQFYLNKQDLKRKNRWGEHIGNLGKAKFDGRKDKNNRSRKIVKLMG